MKSARTLLLDVESIAQTNAMRLEVNTQVLKPEFKNTLK